MNAALPLTCAQGCRTQRSSQTPGQKCSLKQWYGDRSEEKSGVLTFYLLVYYYLFFLIVFLTKLYWHFLEPKLANKYNEMLKRTLNFKYNIHHKMCVTRKRCCDVSAGHSWKEHEVTFSRDQRSCDSLGGTRAAAKNKASKYEMLRKKWRWTCTGYVPGLQSLSMWLLTVLIYHVENQTTISH